MGPVELYGRASLPEGVKLYIDIRNFRHHNDLVSMFNLFDFVTSPKQKFGSAPYFSERELREYDCANKRYRTVEGKRYFDQMGTGKIVDVWHDKDWVNILHDTGEPTHPSEALWRLACALKPIIGQPAPYKGPHSGG